MTHLHSRHVQFETILMEFITLGTFNLFYNQLTGQFNHACTIIKQLQEKLLGLNEYETCVNLEVKRAIKAHIKQTHHFDELEIIVLAPELYVRKKMEGWCAYISSKKRPRF